MAFEYPPLPSKTGNALKYLRINTAGTGFEWVTVSGSGDMVLADPQTVSGLKTFLTSMFGLRNVANTFTAFFTNTITANRTYTLKDADGTIAFVSDITGVNSGTNSGDNSVNTLYSGLDASKQNVDAQLTDLAGLSYVGNTLKVVRVNAGETGWELATVTGSSSDIALSLIAPTLDQTITAGNSAYVSGYYEVADGKFLEVGVGSIFEVG